MKIDPKKYYTFQLISHTAPLEKVFAGETPELLTDHVAGASAFTSNAQKDGVTVMSHRWAVVILTDHDTAHEMKMPIQMVVQVIGGLVGRFRETIEGVFGEEAAALAMMESLAEMLSNTEIVDDDDDDGGDDVISLTPTFLN